MKKIKIAKKTLVLSIAAVIVFSMFGMAAVVNYLSNQTRATIEVSSPISICTRPDNQETYGGDWATETGVIPLGGWVCEDPGGGAGIDLGSIHGGATSSYWVQVSNLGDGNINSNLAFYVSCDLGLTKHNENGDLVIDDFDTISATVYDWDHDAGSATSERIVEIPDVFDASGYGVDYQMDGAGHLIIWFETWLFPNGGDGDVYYVDIDITFAQGAHGNYDIATQVIEDPATWNP